MQTVRIGGPAHVIAEIADSVDADLIVVGTRGRAPVSEILLGSVPIQLLHVAHRPVLVVPPPVKDRSSIPG
jgi:nucleotide-binding universal stress UspA family protein